MEKILKACEMLPNHTKNSISSVINELKSKEAYLGGGCHVVLRVSWAPRQSAGLNEWQGFEYRGQ